MAHKRIDVAIRAFNALGLPLVVVGDGPEWRRLRRLAGPTVRLTGRLSDGEVADLLRSAQALVVTAEEEFGIAAVESLASGRPVIALRAGGVLETVTAGRTGRFYDDGDDPAALAAAVRAFDAARSTRSIASQRRRRFGVEPFQEQLRAIVDEASGRALTSRYRASVGRPITSQIVTKRRRIHEDSLNLSHRGHNQRNPVT